jgi:hypothetical protein
MVHLSLPMNETLIANALQHNFNILSKKKVKWFRMR